MEENTQDVQKNRNKATWNVKKEECDYKEYDGILSVRRL